MASITGSTTGIALPASSETGAQPLDGSAPITSPYPLPDGTVAPTGSTIVKSGDTALVVTYPDGSTRIIYANAVRTDAECKQYSTADINAGLICQTDLKDGSLNYIPTESWTGKVQSWGELKANMDKMARLNDKYPQSSRWNVYYNNPSWHMVIGGSVDPSGKYKTADGSSLAWQITNGNYSVLPYPDDFTPKYIGPTTSSGGSSVFVVDPNTGIKYDTTNVRDPNQAITDDGRSVRDIVYPPPPPKPATLDPGTIGNGTPIAGPIGDTGGTLPVAPNAATTIPVIPPRVPTTANVNNLVQTAAASQPNAGPGQYVLWIIGAAVIAAFALGG